MKITKLSPNFEVKDIRSTVDFYVSHFGFELLMAVPVSQDEVDQAFGSGKDYVYAMVQKGGVELMFQRTDTFKQDVVFSKGLPIGATVSFYMEVEGVEMLHRDLLGKGLEVTELKTAWYGMREFYLQDLNGYILGFAEKA